MTQTTPLRSFTPQEIADIIVETIEETQKDLSNLLEKMHMVAATTAQVCEALRPIGDAGQSRNIEINPLVDVCLSKLQAPKTQILLSHNELCYCLALHAPEVIEMELPPDALEAVQAALIEKEVLMDSRHFTPGATRIAPMLDCFMGLVQSGGTLPESVAFELSSVPPED